MTQDMLEDRQNALLALGMHNTRVVITIYQQSWDPGVSSQEIHEQVCTPLGVCHRSHKQACTFRQPSSCQHSTWLLMEMGFKPWQAEHASIMLAAQKHHRLDIWSILLHTMLIYTFT